jgi:hypothetical protein
MLSLFILIKAAAFLSFVFIVPAALFAIAVLALIFIIIAGF